MSSGTPGVFNEPVATTGKHNPVRVLRETLRPIFVKICRKLLHPRVVNKAAQSCFFIGLTGITGAGVGIILPFLYVRESWWVAPVMQAFGIFCALQLLMNWICIRFVDSSYRPTTHGAKPSELSIGERVVNFPEMENITNGNHHVNKTGVRKDATKHRDNVMYVATSIPETERQPPARTPYPYFSWTPCMLCNRLRPPRCHHCTLCNKCVLKRDHHCFFAGACVGFRNLRHFAVFIFWSVVSTVYAGSHFSLYFYYELLDELSYADLVLPVTVVRGMCGYVSIHALFIITMMYILIGFVLLSTNFFLEVGIWITRGTTSFEVDNRMTVVDTRDLPGKLRAVFGYNWPLNFLLPLHFVYEPVDDPVRWPYVKA